MAKATTSDSKIIYETVFDNKRNHQFTFCEFSNKLNSLSPKAKENVRLQKDLAYE